MTSVLAASCLFVLQHLHASPAPARVGDEVVVVARDAAGDPAATPVEVLLPGGALRSIGGTDGDGVLRFVPEEAGLYAFSTSLGGVRCVAPVTVAAARPRWLLALATAPLGLALLYRHLRRLRA